MSKRVWVSPRRSTTSLLSIKRPTDAPDAILTESRPMALRVSGQLMLGVVRIYGRKVQYLMDDCRDTRERISMTFRPGAVDLPQDQIKASRNAITFEPAGNIDAVDMFDWGSFDVPVADESSRGLHTAPLAQTNLRTREYGAFNFGRPKAASIYGDDNSRAGSVEDSTQHLDSQDFQPIDLDLGLDDMSMEWGRDARSERSRSKSVVPRTPSVIDAMDVDQTFDGGDFAPIDLGLDLGMGLDDLPELEDELELGPGQEREDRRASSELSTPPPPEESTIDLTPRVAKRLAEAKAGPNRKKVRIVRADEELELPDEEFANPSDDSPIIGEENFIPANPEALRLRDIMDDPVGHFLPTVDARIFTGPTGLSAELAELFTFPLNVLRRARPETEEPATPPARPVKRPRKTNAEDEEEVEAARRESRLPSEAFDGGFDGGFDTFDAGDITLDHPTPRRSPTREPSPVVLRERVPSAPLGDGTHPLAGFDTRTLNSQGELESQVSDLGTPRQATQTQTEEELGAGGFSKNTALAMGVLRRELDAIEEEDKKVQFKAVARGASKRAASAMFFELLVLGTRDCVTLEQEKPFGGIEVRAKDRFWQLV